MSHKDRYSIKSPTLKAIKKVKSPLKDLDKKELLNDVNSKENLDTTLKSIDITESTDSIESNFDITSPNARRNKYNKRMMEYMNLSSSQQKSNQSPQQNDELLSPSKKINFSAFEYVLENQLNDYVLANSQSSTIVDELINNGRLCHRRIALSLPNYDMTKLQIQSKRLSTISKSNRKAHDVVTKLLEFWEIFDNIQQDLKLLQQNMLYQINSNERIKDNIDKEKQEFQDRYKQYDEYIQKKNVSYENAILKNEYEIHKLKQKIEDNTEYIQKLQVERDLFLVQVNEQRQLLESVPELETQYLRAARSIVNKNNIKLNQREIKLQKLKDNMKELNYWKLKSQELQFELNQQKNKNKHLEKDLKRLSKSLFTSTTSSTKTKRTAIDILRESLTTLHDSNQEDHQKNEPLEQNDEPLYNDIDRKPRENENHHDKSEPLNKLLFRPQSAPLTRPSIDHETNAMTANDTSNNFQEQTNVASNKKSSMIGRQDRPQSSRPSLSSPATSTEKHISFIDEKDRGKSNELKTYSTSDSFKSSQEILTTRKREQMAGQTSILLKRNAELKEQVCDLSTKLAIARAYPLFAAKPNEVDHPQQSLKDGKAKRERLRNKHNQSSTETNRLSGVSEESTVEDEYDMEDDEDDLYNIPNDETEETDPLTLQARQERRDEILSAYEDRIKKNKTLVTKADIYNWRENYLKRY